MLHTLNLITTFFCPLHHHHEKLPMCALLVAAHCAAAWQAGGVKMFPSAGPSSTTAVASTRSCKTRLRAAGGGGGSKSMTETMASLLAEALGEDSDGAGERFKVQQYYCSMAFHILCRCSRVGRALVSSSF